MNKVDALKKIYKYKNKKSILRISKEIIHSYFLEKEIPNHYITSYLFLKDSNDYKNYVSNQFLVRFYTNYYREIEKEKRTKYLSNKLLFERVLYNNNINTPRIYAYNNKRELNYNNSIFRVKDINHLSEIISLIIKENDNSPIFIKPIDGMGGVDSFKIDSKLNPEKITQLYYLMEFEDFVFQRALQQHKAVNRIYKASINTIRIHTYHDKSTDEVEILSAVMRFGTKGRVVDNGGIYVSVNIENWTLGSIGYSKFKTVGDVHKKHPYSNLIFEGYEIPLSEEIYPLISKASKIFDIDFIGWDIAITDEGLSVIEGNHNPDLQMAQTAYGGFKNDNGFKKIFIRYL